MAEQEEGSGWTRLESIEKLQDVKGIDLRKLREIIESLALKSDDPNVVEEALRKQRERQGLEDLVFYEAGARVFDALALPFKAKATTDDRHLAAPLHFSSGIEKSRLGDVNALRDEYAQVMNSHKMLLSLLGKDVEKSLVNSLRMISRWAIMLCDLKRLRHRA